MSQPTSFEDFLSIEQIAPDQYASEWPTERNSFDPNDKIAYGGCTLALAIKVGYATVEDKYRLFGCLGMFLAPALAGEKLLAKVSIIRDSRTFATRRIEMLQQQGEKLRAVATMQLEFQASEKASLLKYSAATKMQYSPPESSWDDSKMRLHAQNNGVPEKFLRVLDGSMAARKKYFEVLSPPESFAADTLHGMLPQIGSVQKHLSIQEKSTCYYWRTLERSEAPAFNAAALAFLLDAGMPVTPVAFAGIDFKKIGSATSLDFAMRIFSNDIDASQWLKREEKTIVGGEGRTYTEARVWDSTGNMIASMSEQCLLRPKVKL